MNSYKKVVDAAIRASINPDSMRSQYSPDNKYKLGTSLGAGGHGVVYMGQDVQTHEPVAVKITNLQQCLQICTFVCKNRSLT